MSDKNENFGSFTTERPTNIFVVDESRSHGETIKKLCLRSLDQNTISEVNSFITCETALRSFDSNHPDIVLVNVSFGLHECANIVKSIRILEKSRHTGVLFYAQDNEYSDALSVKCLEYGADDFVRANVSDEEFAARIKAVLRLKKMTDALRSANHKLQILTLTDELTGLCNMRAFTKHYKPLFSRCKAGEFGIGIVMMDLDHFKQVNDTTDHLVGSYVIRAVGELIAKSHILEDTDMAARYGGDEFIVLVVGGNLKGLVSRAEKLRKIVNQNPFSKDGHKISITTSLGAAWAPAKTELTGEQLIKAADLMLYRSKALGRDQVTSCSLSTTEDLKYLSCNESKAPKADELIEQV